MEKVTLVNPSAQLITEQDIFKRIEAAGRTCYKSEANITADSARKFCATRIRERHLAMLEFGQLLFDCSGVNDDMVSHMMACKYLNVTKAVLPGGKSRILVSGNIRALNESGVPPLLAALNEYYPELCWNQKDALRDNSVKIALLEDYNDLQDAERLAHAWLSFRCVTNRGVSHELVRHRLCSFAQESTRYVNYKDGISIVPPADWDELPLEVRSIYLDAWDAANDAYGRCIEAGQVPQKARAVLPTALRTEIVLSASLDEWVHFFRLRLRGTTGKPHPDMLQLAQLMWSEVSTSELEKESFQILKRLVFEEKTN